ncbi:hypothetical protein BH23ACT9_BH23ACT9_09900 [soil metagenome]
MPMRNLIAKFFILLLAAAGGVVWWQRRNETPPAPPMRAAEPFMDPVAERVGAGGAAPLAPVATMPGAVVPAEVATAPAGVSLPQPPRTAFAAAPDGPADDLKRISGIGPKLERMLNEQGITTFRQLADMSDSDVDALQQRLSQFPGRIRRDSWVEQAGRLASS